MLLQDYLYNVAEQNPEKSVLIFGDRQVSYGQLAAAGQSIAAWLSGLNLEPGFRGAILSDDPLEYVASYFGILMAGGVAVGLNSQTSERALAYTVNDCGAAVLCVQKKFRRLLEKALPSLPGLQALAVSGGGEVQVPCGCADLTELLTSNTLWDRALAPFRSSCDLAQIIYTSGTTGHPKGVMLRHSCLEANTRSIVSYLKLTADDRIMAVLPFFYSYGNSILLTHIAVGATLVVNQNFMYPNVILQQMIDHRVTGFSGVPSTYAILLHRSAIEKFSFPDLRYLTQAGAAMSPTLAGRLQKIFPGTEIYIMYGQTEASARLAYLDPKELVRRVGSIGKAIPGVTLTLLDRNGCEVKPEEVGEMVARGENIMAGYWQRPKESARVLRREGLWTGDLARRDDDGFLYIISRKSDIIKSGSHRIGPKEIEDVLAEHPAVHEVAVIGVADEILDERVVACLVLKEGYTCSDKELIRFCRKELPAFKVPQEVRFYPELPKTATGKIKKEKLREDGS